MIAKRCNKCGLTKPLDHFRFLNKQNRTMPECKACEKRRRDAIPPVVRDRDYAVKTVANLCKRYDTGILADAIDFIVKEREI